MVPLNFTGNQTILVFAILKFLLQFVQNVLVEDLGHLYFGLRLALAHGRDQIRIRLLRVSPMIYARVKRARERRQVRLLLTFLRLLSTEAIRRRIAYIFSYSLRILRIKAAPCYEMLQVFIEALVAIL